MDVVGAVFGYSANGPGWQVETAREMRGQLSGMKLRLKTVKLMDQCLVLERGVTGVVDG